MIALLYLISIADVRHSASDHMPDTDDEEEEGGGDGK